MTIVWLMQELKKSGIELTISWEPESNWWRLRFSKRIPDGERLTYDWVCRSSLDDLHLDVLVCSSVRKALQAILKKEKEVVA